MKNFIFLGALILGYIHAIAQTNVSGGLYSNTTWTLANSPYIVVDTVVLFPGFTLTIQPGVTVKFANGKFLEIRQSHLMAIGTAIDSITFTSNDPSPTPAIFAGVVLTNNLSSKFSYCNFMYADKAIHAPNSTSDPDTIIHCTFKFNINALLGPGSYSKVVDQCLFSDNSSAIEYCVADITNCRVVNNQYGIQSTVYTKVYNCVIDSNSVLGVSSDAEDSILYNEIKYNATGLQLSDGCCQYSVITGNQIEFNDIGVDLLGPYQKFYCNKICSNTSYALKYESNQNYDWLSNNYWCTSDSLSTTAVIYDGYDNASLGLLGFMPLDTLNCYMTGCNVIISTHVINATCDTCQNGSVFSNVTNAFQPVTYTWNTSPLQTTTIASHLSSGTYTVCISDANGCTACASAFVDSTNCTGFGVTANGQNSTCSSCADGMAWAIISNGTAPYNYSWYTVPMQNSDTATGLPQGSYTICVTDLYGCSTCDTVIISTGNCSAHFNLYPDTIAHHYIAMNLASGVQPLSYSWSWGDGSPNDSTPFPDHSFASAGFYNICLTITDSVGCTNTYCNSFYLMRTLNTMVYVSVRPQAVTGITDLHEDNLFKIFPNPFFGIINIELSAYSPSCMLKLFDLSGKQLLSQPIKAKISMIDLSTFENGLYILEINSNEGFRREYVVKQ